MKDSVFSPKHQKVEKENLRVPKFLEDLQYAQYTQLTFRRYTQYTYTLLHMYIVHVVCMCGFHGIVCRTCTHHVPTSTTNLPFSPI